MRYLGIDFGSKRIGVALSDEGGDFAYAKEVVKNGPDALHVLAELCKKEGVGALVFGESKDFKGQVNAIMKSAKEFAEALSLETKLPLFWEPELFTSLEAQRIQGKNDMHDASAAALILEGYLRRNRSK